MKLMDAVIEKWVPSVIKGIAVLAVLLVLIAIFVGFHFN